jgi:hypothetical protein
VKGLYVIVLQNINLMLTGNRLRLFRVTVSNAGIKLLRAMGQSEIGLVQIYNRYYFNCCGKGSIFEPQT